MPLVGAVDAGEAVMSSPLVGAVVAVVDGVGLSGVEMSSAVEEDGGSMSSGEEGGETGEAELIDGEEASVTRGGGW